MIRGGPPLSLDVLATTPDGQRRRHWSWQDPNPAFAPKDMTFGTAMPGGFDRFTCTMERKAQRFYPDTEELTNITVLGAGGAVAWEGRIEKVPDVGGFQAQETPEAVGWQSHLEDNMAAREIYVDQELARWESAHTQRKINLLTAGYTSLADPSSEPGEPGVLLSITGPAAAKPIAEAWYDAKGIPIGKICPGFTHIMNFGAADTNFTASWRLSTDDVGTTEQEWSLSPVGTEHAPTTFYGATGANKLFAHVLLLYALGITETAQDGVVYGLTWSTLAIYGKHGLPLNLPLPGGVLASDVATHAIGAFAPKIKIGTIAPSSFVIEQLAFLEPTTAAEIIKQASRFELLDWAVWEGPAFYMNERGARGNKWQARIGPAQLQEAGPQINRIWNKVIVAWQDVVGIARTVGPAGVGAEYVAPEGVLNDPNPENPLNQQGISRVAMLKMGTTTLAAAEKVGTIFLRDSKKLEGSGQASLVGSVESAQGVLSPAWAVRAGDEIRFLDAAEPGYRRIVSTSYSDADRVNQLQLDQPPDGMQALLERLSAALVPLGVT